MTRSYALLALLCVSLTGCAPVCTPGSEFEPPLCPSRLPEISSVKILENARAASGYSKEETSSCKQFVLTQDDVQKYLDKARETNANDAHHTLDISPCSANGELTFRNGQTAGWSINQLGSGVLIMQDGSEKILFCPECDFIPSGQ